MGEAMRRRIDDVDKIFTIRKASEACTRSRRIPFYECAQRFRYSTSQLEIEMLAVIGPKTTEACFAKTVRLLKHGVKHRGEIAGRGIDDLQYLGGCGLLLQCFARLGQQPRVLHRDDRLRREILQQRDLLVGEGSYLLAIHRDEPE
jgi:hypothetical protein